MRIAYLVANIIFLSLEANYSASSINCYSKRQVIILNEAVGTERQTAWFVFDPVEIMMEGQSSNILTLLKSFLLSLWKGGLRSSSKIQTGRSEESLL